MDAKYLTWNFANMLSVNLMVAVGIALVVLTMRLRGNKAGASGGK